MEYRINGLFAKSLEVRLEPGEEFYAEKSALIWCDNRMTIKAKWNGNNLIRVISSKISGESVLVIRFANETDETLRLTIGSKLGLLPITPTGGELICRRGCYVGSTSKVDIKAKLSMSGLLGGLGGFLQKVSGDALLFIQTYGDPIRIELKPGETIRIDEDNFLAFEGITEDRIIAQWSVRNMVRGEGLSLLAVTGPGTIYLSPLKKASAQFELWNILGAFV